MLLTTATRGFSLSEIAGKSLQSSRILSRAGANLQPCFDTHFPTINRENFRFFLFNMFSSFLRENLLRPIAEALSASFLTTQILFEHEKYFSFFSRIPYVTSSPTATQREAKFDIMREIISFLVSNTKLCGDCLPIRSIWPAVRPQSTINTWVSNYFCHFHSDSSTYDLVRVVWREIM